MVFSGSRALYSFPDEFPSYSVFFSVVLHAGSLAGSPLVVLIHPSVFVGSPRFSSFGVISLADPGPP